jgi:hypothetical protein
MTRLELECFFVKIGQGQLCIKIQTCEEGQTVQMEPSEGHRMSARMFAVFRDLATCWRSQPERFLLTESEH